MKINYSVSTKEKVYFSLLAIMSCFIYALSLYSYLDGVDQLISIKKNIISIHNDVDQLTYIKKDSISIHIGAFIFLPISIFMGLFLVGTIRGNAVKVSKAQFPDLFELVNTQSKLLGLNKVPSVYVMQQGGVINAFVFRFIRKRHVVLFAPVLEQAYKEGKDVLAFIVGHELGHIKRDHVGGLKTLFRLPASILFFPLYLAYSRACEYTCDSIGNALSPSGAVKGLSLLAVGPKLYTKLNIKEWLANGAQDRGVATWFSEFFSTHPHLVQRVKALSEIHKKQGYKAEVKTL